jgi:hypothetical protein
MRKTTWKTTLGAVLVALAGAGGFVTGVVWATGQLEGDEPATSAPSSQARPR